MRIMSLALNTMMLLMGLYFWVDNGNPNRIEELILLILLMITPLFNILYILQNSGDNFISLYLKRKAMEEKMKIEKMNDTSEK
jgi:hypothetical protein